MRPSIALRANCASWPCVLCTLPNTSPESASKACRAPATVWLSTAMMSGLDTGPPSRAVATALWFRVCATVANPKPVLAVPPPVVPPPALPPPVSPPVAATVATGRWIIAGERQEDIVGVIAERRREKGRDCS